MTKIDALFFEKQMSTKYICQDLHRMIVEFVRPEDLRNLCKVSPIFDKVIHDLGINIVYDYTKTTILDNESIVIRTEGNVLRVLRKDGHLYRSTRNGSYYCKTIRFGGSVDYSKKYYRTKDNKFWCYINNNDGYINIIEAADVFDPVFHDTRITISFREVQHGSYGLTIDLESRWIMNYTHCNYYGDDYQYVFTKFKVIYADGRWQ